MAESLHIFSHSWACLRFRGPFAAKKIRRSAAGGRLGGQNGAKEAPRGSFESITDSKLLHFSIFKIKQISFFTKFTTFMQDSQHIFANSSASALNLKKNSRSQEQLVRYYQNLKITLLNFHELKNNDVVLWHKLTPLISTRSLNDPRLIPRLNRISRDSFDFFLKGQFLIHKNVWGRMSVCQNGLKRVVKVLFYFPTP